MPLRVEELNGGDCRTYLLTEGNAAALVDPLRERIEAYRQLLGTRHLRLEFVLETHTHADHLMLNRVGKTLLGAPVLMHRESPSPLVDRYVADEEVLALGDERIEVIHTPGHTPDSVAYRVPGAVLTGDSLMIGATGRTDFPGGDAGKQYDAIVDHLFTLPEETVVWPAHDYRGHTSSSIGEEKRSNPRFQGKSREEYVALMGGLGLPFPHKIEMSLQVNQSGFEADEVSFPSVTELLVVDEITAEAAGARLASGADLVILDVREPEEFVGELGHIPGALLVPLDALERRLPRLSRHAGREIVVVCRAGARSATAGAILRRAGFERVWNLAGGMLAWSAAKLPIYR